MRITFQSPIQETELSYLKKKKSRCCLIFTEHRSFSFIFFVNFLTRHSVGDQNAIM